MNKICFLTLLGFGLILNASTAPAGEAAKPVADAEAAYTQVIEKRTAEILSGLELKEAAATQRVHDAILNQYRALRDWQAANEGPLKQLAKEAGDEAKTKTAQIMANRKTLHDAFLAKLTADLSPQQLDLVKDKMTYGKLKVTYDAYCEIVPGLTAEEKAKMHEMLVEARELAMDGGSAAEKSLIFKKYKGRINTYLSKNGHDVGKAYKDWGAKQKAAASTGATNHTANPLQN